MGCTVYTLFLTYGIAGASGQGILTGERNVPDTIHIRTMRSICFNLVFVILKSIFFSCIKIAPLPKFEKNHFKNYL